MTITTVIIEDEEKSRLVIEDLVLQYAPDLELVGWAGNVDDAVALIGARAPHLVFLDIQLADGTSFDVLRKLESRNFELICITAFDQYAVQAFRFAAMDYLLKPIGMVEFAESVERARRRIEEKVRQRSIEALLYNLAQQSAMDRKISIATPDAHEFINLRDILWCRAEGAYTVFQLENRTRITSSRSLGWYQDLLNNNNFCRIHHSTIINLSFVSSYIKGKNGYVVMSNGDKLPVSQRRKNDFLDRF